MQTEGGDLRTEIQDRFNYDLTGTMDEIRPGYSFDASCQGTVPAAMISFFEAEDFEDALRNAVSLGGDSDTLACIAGSLAEAAFGVPERTSSFVLGKLPEDLRAVLDSAGLIG
jgi:ADP-ribosylglycohydrolase